MRDAQDAAARPGAAYAFDRAALAELAEAATAEDRALAAAWLALITGEAPAARAAAEALEGRAREAGRADRVVEAAALRALARAAEGALDDATSLARRASRMGRTEALFEPECVAHLVLARVRRLTGYPHLATRILRALCARTPAGLEGWLAWELGMAGARVEAPTDATPIGQASAALTRLLDAADAGASDAYAAAAAALSEAAAALPFVADEAHAILDANDPSRAPTAPDVVAWCAGRTHEAPPALHGVLTRDGAAPTGESAIAYVLARPEAAARRFTRLGCALVGDEALALPQSRRKQGRNETILAALALAGAEGLSDAALFETAYEFRYVPEKHAGSFGVALHRARKYAGDAATIHHDGARARLEVHRPLRIPDPRCKKPLHDKFLCAIADRRGASPRDVAEAVGVSLRIAQATLAGLSAEGSCTARSEGRQIVYEVEDTTFSEPTLLRER